MRRRHHLPRIWLMTDERMGDVCAAIARLPRGSGIVFRHYATPAPDRRALFDRVLRLARKGGHMLILAAPPTTAAAWRADGAHDRSARKSTHVRTMAVHSAREAALARRMDADLIFVSPVFATRSHQGARALGRMRLGMVAGSLRQRTIALGGMNAKRARSLIALNLYGWAGIDAFRI